MNILIIGSGGREYSIGLALSKDKKVSNIYFAPGNGATQKFAKNIDISDFEELSNFAINNNIDLTIVGPEAPLVGGIVDIFRAKGLNIFGPSKKASRLEGSKAYMKNFLRNYNIPTASYIESDNKKELFDFIDNLKTTPIVVKADGLCGGKGVIISPNKDEAKEAVSQMLAGESFGDAGNRVIVEEFLDGFELSIFAICDGDDYIILPAVQDHKRIGDGDTGPNTGGMGAYAPTPLVNEKIYKDVENKVVKPTLEGMKKEGTPYQGVLFIGLMVVNDEIFVLEYNVRFGDPECEILMPLIKNGVFELFYKTSTKDLKNLEIEFYNKFAVGVVIASKNYPYSSSTPAQIIIDEIVDEELEKNSHIVYAGVKKEDETLFATGGRVLLCVGIGDSIKEARDFAYNLSGQVHFMGKKYRKDIAYQALR